MSHVIKYSNTSDQTIFVVLACEPCEEQDAHVHNYRKAGKIPQPTARLNTVYLWDRKDIEQWCGKNTLPPDIEPCNDPCFYCGGEK